MEETINKKSILFVFIFLIITFLFLYKGLILSGDEYLKEYTEFRDNSSKSTTLRKPKNSPKDKIKEEKNNELYTIIQNLVNIQLELSSLGHKIQNGQQQAEDVIEELRTYNLTKNDSTIIKLIDKLDSVQLDNNLIDKLSETLDSNIDLLRIYTNPI